MGKQAQEREQIFSVIHLIDIVRGESFMKTY